MFTRLVKPGINYTPLLRTQYRTLRLHEYQGHQLMHEYRIPIPRGTVAFSGKEAFVIARKFGSDYTSPFVVKA